MKLIAFIKSLLPRFGKDELMEDIRITKNELDTSVLPMYADFSAIVLSSKDCLDLIKIFNRNCTVKISNNPAKFISELYDALKNVRANLDFTEEQMEALLGHDIISEGLTAKKAILIRATEFSSFTSRYALDLLNYMIDRECAENGSEELVTSKQQVEHIESNIANFGRLISILGMPEKEYQKNHESMPDVVINDKTAQAITSVYSESKIDPFSGQVLQGFSGSPIYHIGLMIAEWQADRYKLMKDKKRMLELRMLNLKLLQDKTNDIKVEKEIQYLQNRIEGMEYKMAKMEA